MLQEFDGHLMAKENFIHEQRGKLGEKDKIMFNQKNEMDRLEKKSKMLEYKVKSSISLPRFVLPPPLPRSLHLLSSAAFLYH